MRDRLAFLKDHFGGHGTVLRAITSWSYNSGAKGLYTSHPYAGHPPCSRTAPPSVGLSLALTLPLQGRLKRLEHFRSLRVVEAFIDPEEFL